MADIVIINPRFEISFWGMEHAWTCWAARQSARGLPPLARRAVPRHHNVTLIDENVEDIDFDRLAVPTWCVLPA